MMLASAISLPPAWPSLADGPGTWRQAQRSAKSPPATKTRAPWRGSVRRHSDAGLRLSTSHSPPSESRTIGRSGLRLSRGSSMPSPVRRAASIRALFQARAVGLMQMTPAAGRYVANKFGARYDEKRLLDDQTYNVQLGAAELGDLIKYYRGSYILSVAGYNAGRGRVKDWIAKYGDPRDPKIDPIDWVERIPFSETRNYVQRVLENLQVYRVRFGGGSKLMIEADLRRGAKSN